MKLAVYLTLPCVCVCVCVCVWSVVWGSCIYSRYVLLWRLGVASCGITILDLDSKSGKGYSISHKLQNLSFHSRKGLWIFQNRKPEFNAVVRQLIWDRVTICMDQSDTRAGRSHTFYKAWEATSFCKRFYPPTLSLPTATVLYIPRRTRNNIYNLPLTLNPSHNKLLNLQKHTME